MQYDAGATQTPRERKGVPRAVFELIASVLVLGVLVVMLRPALDRARGSAHGAQCVSNLKELGLGLMQYAQAFDDSYPWRVGALSPVEAWRDLGLVYPYVSDKNSFFCPATKDARSRSERMFFQEAGKLDADGKPPLEPIKSAGSSEVISYSYCFDARGGRHDGKEYDNLPWTEKSKSTTVRLLADKKAGREMTEQSAHQYRGQGRNVLYQDIHVKWKAGTKALDPEPDDDEIGAPGLPDYTAWWSDPPFYGE